MPSFPAPLLPAIGSIRLALTAVPPVKAHYEHNASYAANRGILVTGRAWSYSARSYGFPDDRLWPLREKRPGLARQCRESYLAYLTAQQCQNRGSFNPV